MTALTEPVRPRHCFRWWIAFLLFLTTGLSFFDRQVLSVIAPVIINELGLSNVEYSRIVFAFLLSYTVMFTLGGRLIDWLGTRRGLLISVAVWTVASALHAAAGSAIGFALARFLLGVGEGGCFPGSTKGALEWFPLHERSVAVGFANGGSAFGAVVAPPLTVWLTAAFGWRGAFLGTGLFGIIWLVLWFVFYQTPEESRRASKAEVEYIIAGRPAAEPGDEAPASWRGLLKSREVWALIATRFLLDPVFYFYMFWIPQYLHQQRGSSLEEIGRLTWIPFLTLGISNIAGGWLSDRLVRRGLSLNAARKGIMAAAAMLTPVSILAIYVESAPIAILLLSALMFAHGFWITNYMTMTGDLFAGRTVGTVIGLAGTAGGVGGFLSSLLIGEVAERVGFNPLFVAAGVMYPIGLLVILATIREVRPIVVSRCGCSLC
jgi:ACS family hexuronate transporter-like MFS transporter